MTDRVKMVSVCMITYNHEQYIAEAIEGVVMQKANFNYELIIGEDCSTDKTREICLKYQNLYPDVIRLMQCERNKGMMKNFVDTLHACSGKYIALCEGDDYWTDPDKLQKQVDFLETNPEFILTFHNCKILHHDTFISETLAYDQDKFFEPTEFINAEIRTLTVVFRNVFKDSAFPAKLSKLFNGDLVLFHYLSLLGKACYMHFNGAVYRVHHTGVYSGANDIYRIRNIILSLKGLGNYLPVNYQDNINKWILVHYFMLGEAFYGGEEMKVQYYLNILSVLRFSLVTGNAEYRRFIYSRHWSLLKNFLKINFLFRQD